MTQRLIPAVLLTLGFYEFEQLDGKRAKVNKDQVRTVKEL
jgi:hypothetical protein